MFIYISCHWHLRNKIRRKNFESNRDQQSNGAPKADDEDSLVEDVDKDKELVASFKREILRKNVEINFAWNVVHVFMAVFVVFVGYYDICSYQKSLTMGIDEIRPSFESLYKDEGTCEIFYKIENFNFTLFDVVTCKLLHNKFYRISQILIWYYFVIMICLVTICMVQFSILVSFKNKRLKRLALLLPQIDKDSLEPYANDRNSYFVLEETYRKLDKDQFQRIVKILIEEGYRLDLAMKNMTNV